MQDFVYMMVVLGFFAICLAGIGLLGMEQDRELNHKEGE